MVALIDFDSVIYTSVYKCVSFTKIKDALKRLTKEQAREWLKSEVYYQGVNRCENELMKIQSHLQSIFLEEITSWELYITTCTNSFRKEISSEYKSKRKKNDYVWMIREHYKFNDAFFSDSHEADDLIAIRAKELGKDNCIVVSLDKDLIQIGGWLWSYQKENEIDFNGDIVLNEYGSKNRVFKYKSVDWIEQKEADLFFWKQMLMGDSGDGVKGLSRVGVKTAEKILKGAKNLFIAVAREYISRGQKEDFYTTYKLLKLG